MRLPTVARNAVLTAEGLDLALEGFKSLRWDITEMDAAGISFALELGDAGRGGAVQGGAASAGRQTPAMRGSLDGGQGRLSEPGEASEADGEFSMYPPGAFRLGMGRRNIFFALRGAIRMRGEELQDFFSQNVGRLSRNRNQVPANCARRGRFL